MAIGIDITPGIFDTYTNGQGENGILNPDGNFDMIIVVYRFSKFSVLRPPPPGSPVPSGVTNLGGLGSLNLSLGGMNIIDNSTSGSGVVANGYTQKNVMTTIMHELGHRHFALDHTHYNTLNPSNVDAYGIMGQFNNLTFSGPDKIKLNWAKVTERDINSITGHYTTITLHDGNKVNTTGNEILWIKNGTSRAVGDIVIEARFKSSFMDKDPVQLGLDGDGKDKSLPGNGLYI